MYVILFDDCHIGPYPHAYIVFNCPRGLASLSKKLHASDVSLTPGLDILCPNVDSVDVVTSVELSIVATTGIELVMQSGEYIILERI